MKRIKKYTLIVMSGVAIAFAGCQDQLALQPLSFVTPEQYYQNESELNAALSGVYINLNRSEMYGSFMITNYINGADEIWGGGGGMPDYTFDSNHIDITNFWREAYQGINKANILLSRIDQADAPEAVKTQIKGEALFLRGYYYYLLALNFGGVPIILDPAISLKNIHKSRSSLTDVYNQVVSDMEMAESILKDIDEIGFSGRVSKSAAQGLLARVNLTWAGNPLNEHGKYQEVIKWTSKVINSEKHELNRDFKQIFINHCQDIYDIKESIWEIEFFIVPEGPYAGKGRLGNMLGINCQDMEIGYAGSSSTTGKLFNVFDEDGYDLRRDWTVSNYSYTGAPPNVTKTFFTEDKIYNRFPGKWRREYELTKPKQKNTTPINYPILRYSDILLMYAEADNFINQGPSETAVKYVNEVRRRGFGKFLNRDKGQPSESLMSVRLTEGGSNYVLDENDPVVVSLVGGGGTEYKISAVIENGRIAALNIDSVGTMFHSVPEVIISGGGGFGAKAEVEITSLENADLRQQDVSSFDGFLQAIQDERLRELAFEGTRRFDLIRWDILIPTMRAVAADARANVPNGSTGLFKAGENIMPKHVLYPIPQYEMSLNKLLVQNPGY